ncbi:MAG: hypothetical protein ACK5MW_01275 [Enterococcus sp.]
MGQSIESLSYKEFIQKLGIVPNHNYLTGRKIFNQSLYYLRSNFLNTLLNRFYLVVFTKEKIILKKLGSDLYVNELNEENYQENLTMIPVAEIQRFSTQEEYLFNRFMGIWVKIKTAKKTYLFFLHESVDIPEANLRLLQENNFYMDAVKGESK